MNVCGQEGGPCAVLAISVSLSRIFSGQGDLQQLQNEGVSNDFLIIFFFYFSLPSWSSATLRVRSCDITEHKLNSKLQTERCL